MQSENVLDCSNQQERLEQIGWIVGFVDGEGCFAISLHKNPTTSLGWQIMPEFILSQGEKSLNVLKMVKDYFNCGRISVNHRHDNHREDLYRFCVKSQKELRDKIIPFFKEYQLKTSKKNDFEIFSEVLELMRKKEHLSQKGIKKIINLIEKMNTKKKRQFVLESPETTR